MSENTPLDDILNDQIDEVEESPDTPQAEPEAVSATPEPPPEEASSEKPEDPSPSIPDPSDDKTGLPPAFHARVKAANEAKKAAEDRANELERQLAALQTQPQQQEQQQPTINDVLTNMQSATQQQIQQMKVSMDRRLAEQVHGPELVGQAYEWAVSKCASDPVFNNKMMQSGSPITDAVAAFNQELLAVELQQYGGDINKLIEAKIAERGSAAQETAPVTTQQAPAMAMPSDFSKASSKTQGGNRSQAWSGPTPLGDILNS